MKKQLVASLILIVTPILLVSCVSSLLQEKAPTFSSEVKYTEPRAPFVRLNKSVYPSWKNKETGNVISIVSDCSEITLEGLQQLIEGSLDKVITVAKENVTYKNKPALGQVTVGLIDSQQIQINSKSFKRKNCGYVTSLSGRIKNLDVDKTNLLQFEESLTFE